jgi:hypothetical protein
MVLAIFHQEIVFLQNDISVKLTMVGLLVERDQDVMKHLKITLQDPQRKVE